MLLIKKKTFIFWKHVQNILRMCFSTGHFPIGVQLLICLNWFERERETSVCCFTYLCTHWLLLICTCTRNQTCNLGIWGQRSNQLSYPARPNGVLLLMAWKRTLYSIPLFVLSSEWFSQALRKIDTLWYVP